MIAIIVAMGRNRAIGKDNKIPWSLPEDLKRFKETTFGHAVLMGRKTFESIGKALPGRNNIVLSRSPENMKMTEGITVVNSLEAGLNACPEGKDIFVIGGAEIYGQVLRKAGMLYVTFINHDFAGDAFFPEIDKSVFELVEQSALQHGGNTAPYHYCYQRYRRKGQCSPPL